MLNMQQQFDVPASCLAADLLQFSLVNVQMVAHFFGELRCMMT